MLKLEKVTVDENIAVITLPFTRCYVKTLTLCFSKGKERATVDLNLELDQRDSDPRATTARHASPSL